MKKQKLLGDVKTFTIEDIQALEKEVILKRLKKMKTGKRYFYHLVQGLCQDIVLEGSGSLLGAVIKFNRHQESTSLTGFVIIFIYIFLPEKCHSRQLTLENHNRLGLQQTLDTT